MILTDENWILSQVHNHPHDALAENSDYLYTSLTNLSGKLGLSQLQKKLDGFPIWHNTYYVRTGMTFVEALSTLDNEIKALEDLHRTVLFNLAFGAAIEWTTSISQEVTVISDSVSYPDYIQVTDLGSFLWLLHPGASRTGVIYKTDNLKSTWSTVNKTVAGIFGEAYALEKHTLPFLVMSTNEVAHLFCGAYNETTESGKAYYLKGTYGYVDYGSGSIGFESEGTSQASQYILLSELGTYIRYNQTMFTSDYAYLMLFTHQSDDWSYLLDREDRLLSSSDTHIYRYTRGSSVPSMNSTDPITNRDQMELYVQGIDGNARIERFSHVEIKPVKNNKWGMVLVDEYGNLVYRENDQDTPEVWTRISGAVDYGVIQRKVTGYGFDYPTFLPVYDGFICFYNTDYRNGTLDDIHYAFSRNGTTWEIPPTYLGITGIFPKLIQTRNGTIYLLYWTGSGIKLVRVYLSTNRTVTIGGI
jgi:hypothetical protein